MINRLTYGPVSSAALNEAISSSNSHTIALKQICEIAGIQSVEVTGMRTLAQTLLALDMRESDIKVVREKAKYLNFSNKQWDFSKERITECLHLLSNPLINIPSDTPMHYSALFSHDRDLLVLSAFGPNAPTFVMPNCRVFSLTNRIHDKDISKICVRLVSLTEAVHDIKHIRTSKSFSNNPIREPATIAFRTYRTPEIPAILKELRTLAGSDNVSEPQTSVGAGESKSSNMFDI